MGCVGGGVEEEEVVVVMWCGTGRKTDRQAPKHPSPPVIPTPTPKTQPPPAAADSSDPPVATPSYFPRALAFLYVLNDCFFAFDDESALVVTDEGAGAPTSGGWVVVTMCQ